MRGHEIRHMEELQDKKDVLLGLKLDTLTKEMESIKENWQSQ